MFEMFLLSGVCVVLILFGAFSYKVLPGKGSSMLDIKGSNDDQYYVMLEGMAWYDNAIEQEMTELRTMIVSNRCQSEQEQRIKRIASFRAKRCCHILSWNESQVGVKNPRLLPTNDTTVTEMRDEIEKLEDQYETLRKHKCRATEDTARLHQIDIQMRYTEAKIRITKTLRAVLIKYFQSQHSE